MNVTCEWPLTITIIVYVISIYMSEAFKLVFMGKFFNVSSTKKNEEQRNENEKMWEKLEKGRQALNNLNPTHPYPSSMKYFIVIMKTFTS